MDTSLGHGVSQLCSRHCDLDLCSKQGALGPWVAHLRVRFIKEEESKALKLNFSLYEFSAKHFTFWSGATFGPQGHKLKEFRRGSLDDAIYIISRLYA